MRPFLRSLACGLATAALMVTTPLNAAVFDGPQRTTLALPATSTTTPLDTTGEMTTARPPAVRPASAEPDEHTGGGWDEPYCIACVGVGTFALYSGGISMLPVILANPQAVTTLAGSCLLACRAVLDDLM